MMTDTFVGWNSSLSVLMLQGHALYTAGLTFLFCLWLTLTLYLLSTLFFPSRRTKVRPLSTPSPSPLQTNDKVSPQRSTSPSEKGLFEGVGGEVLQMRALWTQPESPQVQRLSHHQLILTLYFLCHFGVCCLGGCVLLGATFLQDISWTHTFTATRDSLPWTLLIGALWSHHEGSLGLMVVLASAIALISWLVLVRSGPFPFIHSTYALEHFEGFVLRTFLNQPVLLSPLKEGGDPQEKEEGVGVLEGASVNRLYVWAWGLGTPSMVLTVYLKVTSDPLMKTLDPLVFPWVQGKGLTPALQDIALAIHPPCLFLGLMLTSVLMVLGLAWKETTLLLSLPLDHPHLMSLSPWMNLSSFKEAFLRMGLRVRFALYASWVCVSLGLAWGSWWAYAELGWGGYWFWDPVENIALLPWLILTATLHALESTSSSTSLSTSSFSVGVWGVMGSRLVQGMWWGLLSAYLWVLVGTWGVRSGLLTSVHAFAQDTTRAWALGLLLGFLCVSLLLMHHLLLSPFSSLRLKRSSLTETSSSSREALSTLPLDKQGHETSSRMHRLGWAGGVCVGMACWVVWGLVLPLLGQTGFQWSGGEWGGEWVVGARYYEWACLTCLLTLLSLWSLSYLGGFSLSTALFLCVGMMGLSVGGIFFWNEGHGREHFPLYSLGEEMTFLPLMVCVCVCVCLYGFIQGGVLLKTTFFQEGGLRGWVVRQMFRSTFWAHNAFVLMVFSACWAVFTYECVEGAWGVGDRGVCGPFVFTCMGCVFESQADGLGALDEGVDVMRMTLVWSTLENPTEVIRTLYPTKVYFDEGTVGSMTLWDRPLRTYSSFGGSWGYDYNVTLHHPVETPEGPWWMKVETRAGMTTFWMGCLMGMGAGCLRMIETLKDLRRLHAQPHHHTIR